MLDQLHRETKKKKNKKNKTKAGMCTNCLHALLLRECNTLVEFDERNLKIKTNLKKRCIISGLLFPLTDVPDTNKTVSLIAITSRDCSQNFIYSEVS